MLKPKTAQFPILGFFFIDREVSAAAVPPWPPRLNPLLSSVKARSPSPDVSKVRNLWKATVQGETGGVTPACVQSSQVSKTALFLVSIEAA